MDDAKNLFRILFHHVSSGALRLTVLLLLLIPFARAHGDVSYISPAKISGMKADFDAAKYDPGFRSKLEEKSWACEMYGVRTKLQVQKGVPLYRLKPVEAKPGEVQSFVNTGDEPVARYQVKGDSLEGRGEKDLLDQIRVTKDGRLISKLSSPSRGITIAYAVCTGS